MKLTFIDSGVLITAARGKERIAEHALAILDDPDRSFVSSDFVKLEVLPKATYNGYKEEKEFYETFFAAVTRWVDTSKAILDDAFEEACKAGLSAVDALHVAIAKAAKVDEFITTEKTTKPFFKNSALKVISIRSI